MRARLQLFGYFGEMPAERRSSPMDDIVSVMGNASLRDAPVPTVELLSYFFLLGVAGEETTRNA